MYSYRFSYILSKISQKKVVLGIFIIFLSYLPLSRCLSFYWQSRSISYRVVTNTLPIKLKWGYILPNPIAILPVANEELLLVLDDQGSLVAFDNETGNIKWQYDFEDIPKLRSGLMFEMQLNNEYVVTTNSRAVVALNVENGNLVWTKPLLYPLDSNMPGILIVENAVVVVEDDKNRRRSQITVYNLRSGEEIGYIEGLNSYATAFACPYIPIAKVVGADSVCFLVYKSLDLFNAGTNNPIELQNSLVTIPIRLISNSLPSYKQNRIFTNPGSKSTLAVFDLDSYNTFYLPSRCVEHLEFGTAQPASFYENNLFIITSCGELYALNIYQLSQQPSWLIEIPDEVLSPLITLDGKVGFILTNRGSIKSIDLKTGNFTGEFIVTPDYLSANRLSYLGSSFSNLIAILNGQQIFVLSNKPDQIDQ